MTVVACDRCKRYEPEVVVRRYTVEFPEGKVRLDLCEEHAEPLAELRELAGPGRLEPRKVGRRGIRKTDVAELPPPAKAAPTTALKGVRRSR